MTRTRELLRLAGYVRSLVPPAVDDLVGTLGDLIRLVCGDDTQDHAPGLTSGRVLPYSIRTEVLDTCQNFRTQ